MTKPYSEVYKQKHVGRWCWTLGLTPTPYVGGPIIRSATFFVTRVACA